MSWLIQEPAARVWERRSILQRLSLRRALERERLTSLLDHLVKLQIVSIAGSDSSSARPTSTAGHPRADGTQFTFAVRQSCCEPLTTKAFPLLRWP